VDYVSFLDKYIGKFFWVANLDIDSVVGHAKIVEWNKLFENIEKEGQQVCFVAHDRSSQFLCAKEYLDKYSFVGASGVKQELFERYFLYMYTYSRKFNKKVHGFGLTNFVTMQNFPTYTADSTTYLGGTKFGSTYVWNGSYFETWDTMQKHYRKQLKYDCDKWEISFKKLMLDDFESVLKFNIRSWLENEKWFNRRTIQKQFWLTEEEKGAIRNGASKEWFNKGNEDNKVIVNP
jgi:hypothetical protein